MPSEIVLKITKDGPLSGLQLALRPLTLLVGENGTGKTCVAKSLYSVAQFMQIAPDAPPSKAAFAPLDDAIESLLDRISDQAKQRRLGEVYEEVLHRRDFPDDVFRTTTSIKWELRQIHEYLEPDEPDDSAEEEPHLVKALSLATDPETLPPESEILRFTISGLRVTIGYGEFTYSTPLEAILNKESRDPVRDTIRRAVTGKFRRVVYFPVDRFGLQSSVASRAWLARQDAASAPERDFSLLYDRLVSEWSILEGDANMAELATALFESRLGVISVHGKGPVQILPSGDRVQLRDAAGSVRASSSLSMYLTLMARPGDLIIIDEPELCAHPKHQIRIAEVLCAAVNRGISVLATTQSPYIVDHISTLLLGSRLTGERREVARSLTATGLDDAFISPEKVAVYEFSDLGKFTEAIDRHAAAIDWSTFGRISTESSAFAARLLELEDEEDKANV